LIMAYWQMNVKCQSNVQLPTSTWMWHCKRRTILCKQHS